MRKKIILGSGSPRRAEILQMAGYSIEIMKAGVEEIIEEGTPIEGTAEFLAQLKGHALKDKISTDDILLTADTVVVLANTILGKPKDKDDAVRMLKMLSGNTHTVYTGVYITHKGIEQSFTDKTSVTFSELDNNMIDYYLETCQPYDKAGAYGVQEYLGMVGVSKMEGSFYTVMGLPIHKVFEALKEFN